jgi:hypothetical protein
MVVAVMATHAADATMIELAGEQHFDELFCRQRRRSREQLDAM